jgi:hypothetical protein
MRSFLGLVLGCLTILPSGCASSVAADHVHRELPLMDGFVRIAEDPNSTKEDLKLVIYKNRYTMYTLDHVLNDGPDPTTLDLLPPGGWFSTISPVSSN